MGEGIFKHTFEDFHNILSLIGGDNQHQGQLIANQHYLLVRVDVTALLLVTHKPVF